MRWRLLISALALLALAPVVLASGVSVSPGAYTGASSTGSLSFRVTSRHTLSALRYRVQVTCYKSGQSSSGLATYSFSGGSAMPANEKVAKRGETDIIFNDSKFHGSLVHTHVTFVFSSRNDPVHITLNIPTNPQIGVCVSSSSFNTSSTSAAPRTATGSTAGLPPQGVFAQACPFSTMTSACDAQLSDIKRAGFSIVVTSPPGANPSFTPAYLQAFSSNHLQGMWELDAPGWWGDNGTAPWGYNPHGTNMLSQYASYQKLCGCKTNDQLLTYIVTYLAGGGATYGWYIADDSQFAAVGTPLYQEQVAGLTAFGARLKQLAPSTHTVIADCCNNGTSQLQNSYQVADFTAHELYPIFSFADSDPLTGSVVGAANFQNAGAVQQLMDSYHKPSALILQAFDWGMDKVDAKNVGDNPNIDAYPTPTQQLVMRNQALLASDPQLILWFYWNDTAGWPTGTVPSYFYTPPSAAVLSARVAGLTAAVTAPPPTSSATLSVSSSIVPIGLPIQVSARASVLGGVTSLSLDPGTGKSSPLPVGGSTTLTFPYPGTYTLHLHAVGRLATADATTTVKVLPALTPPQIAYCKVSQILSKRMVSFTYGLDKAATVRLVVTRLGKYAPEFVRTLRGYPGQNIYSTQSLLIGQYRGQYRVSIVGFNSQGPGPTLVTYFRAG